MFSTGGFGGCILLGQELVQWSQECLAIGDSKARMLELAHHGFKFIARGMSTAKHLLDGVPELLKFSRR